MKGIARITLLVVLLFGGMVQLGWCQEDKEQHFNKLNAKSVTMYQQGKYQESISLAEQAYAYALKNLGPEHHATLTAMNNVATFYLSSGRFSKAEYIFKQALTIFKKSSGHKYEDIANLMNGLALSYQLQKRYGEAELLYKKALREIEEILGKDHSLSANVMDNLAELYYAQGQYKRAEDFLLRTLQFREKILGTEDPVTLGSLNKLAVFYRFLGRYSEAEPLLERVLMSRTKLLGPEHIDTLSALRNLGGLYRAQERYKEAEALLKMFLQLSKKLLGSEHPDTLDSMNNLALLCHYQGKFGEAEQLYKKTLQLRRKVLGQYHRQTLNSLGSLAALYNSQKRDTEAELLLKEALHSKETVLGREDPDTLTAINNLADFYRSRRRYSEAEKLFKKMLPLSTKILGGDHPHTLISRTNYAALLISTSRPDLALKQLQETEDNLLSQSFKEVYANASDGIRRKYLQTITAFQEIFISLAKQQAERKYQHFSVTAILRWKQLYAEEEALQYQLLARSSDPQVIELKNQLDGVRVKLSQLLRRKPKKQEIASLIVRHDQLKNNLRGVARHLKTELAVADINLEHILSRLSQQSGLIEYRLFVPADTLTDGYVYHSRKNAHLATLLLLADPQAKQQFVFRDLGPLVEIEKHLKDKTAEAYNRLLGPFDEQIKKLKQLYIAPDGPLNLLSFASLRLPDGRFLAERQQINRLQTGRDLLADNSVVSGKGLVAIGGAEYGEPPADQVQSTPKLAASYQQRAVQMLRAGVAFLKNSGPEAQNIGKIFTNNISDDVQVFLGNNASEHTLENLKHPPRILHLSTHGFYLANEEKSKLADEAPLLLSGLALAGANNGLQGKLDKHGDDGLLYSLEVLGLNLQGTELVSLSACDTGKGVVDYSEGVYGLVRAFRTAGAKNVLMTLTPVGDEVSKDFMTTFYDNWLSSEDNISPAQALHKTRLNFIHHKNTAYRDPAVWSPYVLVGK